MLTIIDVIYFIVLFSSSYFTFFFLILWFENKDYKGKVSKKNQKLPPLTILIPVYNEEEIIGKVLEHLRKISYPKNKLKVIVIDDGSKDKTYEIAKSYESSNIKVLTKTNTGKAASLNFGLKFVKTEYVAVMDGDSFLSKNALRNCMKYFDEEDVAAVTSHILVKKKENLWEKIQNMEMMVISVMRKAQEKMNLINATPGPLSVYKTKILLKVGKFDEKNIVEDAEIAWRLIKNGYKIRMAFDAMVYSIYPDDFRNWWGQRIRWGIGGIQTFSKYVNCFLRRECHGVGNFLVPTTLMTYFFVLLGIGIFLFQGINWIVNNALYLVNSLYMGVNPFARMDIFYVIDVRLVYGFLLFLVSLYLIRLTLSTHKEKPDIKNLILFLFVYSLMVPLIILYSIYKYTRKESGWLTK